MEGEFERQWRRSHFEVRTFSCMDYLVDKFRGHTILLIGEDHVSGIYRDNLNRDHETAFVQEFGTSEDVPVRLLIRDLAIRLYRERVISRFRVLALEVDDIALAARQNNVPFATFLSRGVPRDIKHRKAFWYHEMIGAADTYSAAMRELLMAVALACSDCELVVTGIDAVRTRIDAALRSNEPPAIRQAIIDRATEDREEQMTMNLKNLLSGSTVGETFICPGTGSAITEGQIANRGKVLALLGNRHVEKSVPSVGEDEGVWRMFRERLSTGTNPIPSGQIFSVRSVWGGSTSVEIWGQNRSGRTNPPITREGTQVPQSVPMDFSRVLTARREQSRTFIRLYDILRAYYLSSNLALNIGAEVDALHPSNANPPSGSYDGVIYLRGISGWDELHQLADAGRSPRYEDRIPPRLTSVFPTEVTAAMLRPPLGQTQIFLQLIGRRIAPTGRPVEVVIRSLTSPGRVRPYRGVDLFAITDSFLTVRIGAECLGMGDCVVEVNISPNSPQWEQAILRGVLRIGG